VNRFLSHARQLDPWIVAPAVALTLVGLANLMDPDAAGAGEVAFLLADAWQNRGLGSQLVDLVTDLGRDEGARSLHADVTLDNGRMRTLFARRGWTAAIGTGRSRGCFPWRSSRCS
jgi:RimJ/RimL family protein N-acetyltransferase